MPDIKRDVFALVHEFNDKIIGFPVPRIPQMLVGGRKDYAKGHLLEEVTEFDEATTVEDQVDALVDLIYVAMGRLNEMGVDGRAHFDEVHDANMHRVRGQKSTRPNSMGYDAIKPEGWVGPDHTRVLLERRPKQLQLQQAVQANQVLFPVTTRVVAFNTSPGLEGKAGEVVDLPTEGGITVRFDDPDLPVVVCSPNELKREERGACSDCGELHRPLRIMVMGYARHGKDTVSELLRDKYGKRFTSSSAFCAERVILPWFQANPGQFQYKDAQACFDDRGNHRELWYELITAFNTPDLTSLGRAIYEEHDLYCGIRNAREFHALRNAGVFDVAIWVDAFERIGTKEDPSSCTVEPWMADFVLDNNGDLSDLERNLDVLMTEQGLV